MVRAWLVSLALVAACGFGDNPVHDTIQQLCGDGVQTPGEGCDDGNTVDGDGCSAICAVETDRPACGNGVLETGEDCDDRNTANGDGCSAACANEAACGNGIIERDEQCDDHNTTSGDGCSATCTKEAAPACVLVPQSGCATGGACDIADDTTGETGCRDITVMGTSDSRCADDTECSAGFTCVSDKTLSYCMRFCAAEGDCPGTNSRCAFNLTNSSGTQLGVKVCSNSCSVLAQTGCPSGTGCIGIESSAGDFTDCRKMEGQLDGQTCTSSTECLPGSVCVSDGSGKTCREYCDTADVICSSGEVCTAFSTPLVISGITLGACM